MNEDFLLNKDSLSLKERKYLSVTGVSDVDSFDEKTINAITTGGILEIKGDGLKILNLNTESGDLKVEGDNISSLVFFGQQSEKSGFFKRLFK